MGQKRENRKGQPSLPCVITSDRQHCSIKLSYGIPSREELRNSAHHHSFLPISISCGVPTAASIQTCPHSQSNILSVLRGKVLTHSTKASLSCCVGTAAQRRAPPGAKSTGTRPSHCSPASSLNRPDQNHCCRYVCD